MATGRAASIQRNNERRARNVASKSSSAPSSSGNTVTAPAPSTEPVVSGSLKDLSIALANQPGGKGGSGGGGASSPIGSSGGGSLKDLSIGLAQGNAITQDDIADAQSGGASLASRTAAAPASGGSTAPGSTAPASSPQTGVEDDGGYYSRYSRDEEEDEPVVDEPNFDDIYKRMTRDAQKEINSLNQYEKDLLDEQAGINAKDERSTSAINTLTGLAGSTEADINQRETTQAGQKANQLIRDQVQVKVQGILSNIRKDALEQYKYERTEHRIDEAAAREKATTNATLLAQSGATADGYKQTDPEGYAYIAKQVGGEDVLKAMFTLNRPKETILDKKIEGGKYVIAYQNPLDDKIRIETVDLGLPPQYSKTVDAGNRILAIPDDWDGDPSKLVTINKGLTPGQAAGGSGAATGAYGSDLDAIIGATEATITSKFGQQTFRNQMARARDDADKINLVASVVLGKADSATKADFSNQAVGMRQIDKAIAKIDAGLKSGFLESNAQYAANFFGKDYDPKLAEVDQLIVSAIQPYRNSVTGAAWGDQEDNEYQMLFGSTKYSPAELRQRLVGVKEILASKSATALNSYVNPLGYYSNPFESGDLGSQDLSQYTDEELERIANGG